MSPTPSYLRIPERDRFGRITRSRLGRFECLNCGRRHIGFFETWFLWEGGSEVDFIWTDWEGNERICGSGHRRFPCDGPGCWRCDRANR